MSSMSPRNPTEQEQLRPGQEKREEDGGYGWIVVIASFFINMVVDGISYSFGILLEPMKTELQSNTGSVSLVGSTLAGMTMLTGPVSAACCNRFGTRKTCILGGLISSISLLVSSYCNTTLSIIISYGLLGGFGLGLMYVPAVVCVSQYFNKQLSLATGISVCGSGAGTFLFAPLVAKLVGLYGWRGCNRALACLCVICMLIGLALVPKLRGQHNGEQKTFNLNILRKSSFLLVLIGNVPTVMAVYALYSYLPMLAESTGLAKLESSYLISAVGITNTLGRILAGWIADLPHISALRMTTLATIIAGILPSIFLLCSSHATFLILSSLFGLIISVIPSVTSALIVEILGKQDLSSGFGMLTFVRGLAALAGPPISGLIHDTTNSYSASFYLASVELIASGLIHGYIVLLLHRRRHQYQAI